MITNSYPSGAQHDTDILLKSWSFHGDRIQWNFLRQTAASICEVFPMFQGLALSPSSGCCGWFGRTKTGVGSTKPPAMPWRWGRSQSLKCPKTFTSWRASLPEEISTHSPYPQAVSAVWRKGYTLHQFLILRSHIYSGLMIKCTDASAKLFQLEASLNDPFPTHVLAM